MYTSAYSNDWNPVNKETATQIFDRRLTTGDRHKDHASWLAMRREGIGASEAPAIMSRCRWSSPLRVWGEKLGTIDGAEQTEAMQWGNRLEELILEAYADETGATVAGNQWTYRNEERSYLLASPDAFQEREDKDGVGLVQAKNTMIGWDEEIPESTWIQMQAEMAATGLQYNTAVALIMGNRLLHQTVDRDDSFIDEHLLPRVDAFWEHVLAATEPPKEFIDGTDATKKALAILYPESDDTAAATLDGEFQLHHDELVANKEIMKKLKSRSAEIENMLRAAIGASSHGVLPDGGVYTLKTQTRAAHEVKASTFRVLRFKKGKA